MFETEADEYANKYFCCDFDVDNEVWLAVRTHFIDGAEFGYNKGYHDAEEHYLNVIDNQHKLIRMGDKRK